MTKKKLLFAIIALIAVLAYIPIKNTLVLSPIISLGVSTDGRYVISAHASRKTFQFSDTYVVLWDIKAKSKKVLAEGINPFSAYFIPDSHEFIWQGSDNVVHIQNIEGKETQSFKHFLVRSHLMSADKKTYISANRKYHLYKGYGDNKKLFLNYNFGGLAPFNLSMAGDFLLTAGDSVSNVDSSKMFNKIFYPPVIPVPKPKDYPSTSRYHEVTLWDKNTLKPVAYLEGNDGSTFGILSPDGKWAISGCENGHNYMWSTDNLDYRLKLAKPFRGIYIGNKNTESFDWDDSQLLAPPPEFEYKLFSNRTIAYAFLTETDFIHLGDINDPEDSVAPLYTVGDPWIKGYLDLQADPMPSLDSYIRGLSIASSYKAHVLVTGQAVKGGINVYQYHPDKKELERIWVGGQFKYW